MHIIAKYGVIFSRQSIKFSIMMKMLRAKRFNLRRNVTEQSNRRIEKSMGIRGLARQLHVNERGEIVA